MVQASELGERIRKLRENHGLTREAFCQDGSQLSVRQLARIERGVSNPTMAKLRYIASVLGILLSDLVEQLYQELPRGYHVLKFQLFHQKTYKNRKLLEQKRLLLMK